ncbi:MAG: DNA gyrase subunit A, partial [Bacteroidota bacterium]
VDGQGNFGSVDGDSPADMRYTETRLHKIAEEMLADIDKNTVDFTENFDDSLTEPTVLPAKIPNLLANGASGIAVGMATNMAPHNLTEIGAAVAAYIDNRDITVEELMEHIKAPDFPTGGIIYGYDGVREAFKTGRGKITLRAKVRIEELRGGREQIIVTELPYQVNKAVLHEKIAMLGHEKKIEGISVARDESDRDGMRLVIECKRDAMASVVLNNLYKHTQMQTNFNVNNVCLVKGRPQQLNLKQMIHHFVEHRHEVITRRTQYELEQAEHRAHILEGLIIALDNLDEVIKLIRASKTPDEAKEGLISKFELSEIQAKAILDMRLQRLTNLEVTKIRKEYEDLLKLIEDLKDILATEGRRMQIIKDETAEMVKKYGDERRTEIVHSAEDFSVEDMIANEDVVITISHAGYIKRTALKGYRQQRRGGTGAKGASSREEDFLEHIFIASTHNYMLFFTEKGMCYWLKVFEIPEGSRSTKGRAIQNLIQLEKDDTILTFMTVPNLDDEAFLNSHFVMMATKQGQIKKTSLEEYSRPRTNGIIAISIKEGDKLLAAKLVQEDDEVVLGTRNGNAIRFEASDTRPMGRNTAGVRGIRLDDELEDEVVGMVVVNREHGELLTVSENGYGKRTNLTEYRVQSRGGKGLKTINITPKTGKLIGLVEANDGEELMILTKNGLAIRMSVTPIPITGRATQGVRLIRLKKDDQIASVVKVAKSDDEDDAPDEAVITDPGNA